MAVRDPIQEFMSFNRPFARRSPELLRFKVARMAEGAFAFFRGTFHVFARDVLDGGWQLSPLLRGDGLEMDLVGDIHSDNFGTFKADDGAIHYDVNDFDETTHGRFDFDVCRLATSLFLAARDRGDPLAQAVQPPLAFLTTYTDTVRRLLKRGRDPQLDTSTEEECGCAPVDALLATAAAAKRTAFIARLTEERGGRRQLLRSARYFNLPDDEREQARRLMVDYVRRHPNTRNVKGYYDVEDVCGRVSGIGSMGRLRYLVLVAGKGSKEARNVLLEFKEARPSAYDVYRKREADATALRDRAERVVQMQRQSQAASSNHLGFAVDGGASFQVRELGPADGRVDTRGLKGPEGLACVARVQAGILARTHARSAMRAVGPANPLAELADADTFNQRVLAFALEYADVVVSDWTRFVGARAAIDDVASWAGAS